MAIYLTMWVLVGELGLLIVFLNLPDDQRRPTLAKAASMAVTCGILGPGTIAVILHAHWVKRQSKR